MLYNISTWAKKRNDGTSVNPRVPLLAIHPYIWLHRDIVRFMLMKGQQKYTKESFYFGRIMK